MMMTGTNSARWNDTDIAELTSNDRSRDILNDYISDVSEYLQHIINKRSTPRLPCYGEAVIFRPAHRAAVPLCLAWGNDISCSGMSATTRQPVYVGETFQIDLHHIVRNDLRLLIHITNSRKLIDGIYRTGGYFLFNEK